MSADGLAGRLAVVTGALGNLGPVWTSALAGAGATVVGLDVRAGDGVVQADVTDRAGLERVLVEVGTPAILVNNAGIDAPPGGGEGEFARTLEVNVTGLYNATEVFGGAMCEGGGRLDRQHRLAVRLDRADPGALRPHRAAVHEGRRRTAPREAAVVNLTRYFARLWGSHGVREQQLTGGVHGGQDAEFVAKYSGRSRSGRMAEPADPGRRAALPRLRRLGLRDRTGAAC
jgi:NAD(P)-dependent dehydrogenase (short-subunit alcohol dehydrogenase family)